jgi:hypothetical protein
VSRGRRRREPIATTSEWFCVTCEDREPRGHGDAIAHLRLDHGLTGPIRGRRSMSLHLDMADRYSSSYDWTIGTIKLVQVVTGPR